MADGDRATKDRENPFGNPQAVPEESEGLGFLPLPCAERSRAKEYCSVSILMKHLIP